MNEFDILKELEKLDDDIEPGFLGELKQQAPVELHSRIMESIRMEALARNSSEIVAGIAEDSEKDLKPVELKKRFRFNYRKYATVASAAVILAVVFVGGAKEMLQRSITPETLTPNQSLVMKAGTTDQGNETKNQTFDVQTTQGTFGNTQPTIKSSPGNVKGDKSDNAKSGRASLAQAATKPDNVKPKSTPAAANRKTQTPKPGIVAGKSNQQPGFTIVSSKKGDTKDNSGTVGQTTTTAGKTEGTEPSVAVKDNANPAATTGNEGSNTGDNNTGKSNEELLVASLENIVNFEITISDNQTNITQFLDDKATKLANGIFKLKTSDYETLNQMLAEIKVEPTKVNELDKDTQSVVVKIVIK